MKFAYSTNAFRFYPVERAVDLIAGAGFEGVELLADFPHLFPADWTDRARLAGLREHLAARGLAVTNLNAFSLYAIGDNAHPSWIQDDPAARSARLNYTLACLPLAAAIGAPSITVMPGGLREADTPAAWNDATDRFLDGFAQLLTPAREHGVRLLLEPEPGCVIETVRDFDRFVARLAQRTSSMPEVDLHATIGMNCDVGHIVCAGDDPAVVIRDYAPWIRHVHLEDIKGRTHEHLICGQGDIDFAAIFDALRSIDYAGYLCVELYPYQDRPVEAGTLSLAHLRPLLAGIATR